MASYSTNQLKRGLKVMLDNYPCSIIECEFYKPGKGQSLHRVKLRNLITGRVLDRTYTSADSFEAADVYQTEMQYLYNDAGSWHFMDPDTFEQVEANAAAMGETHLWIKEEDLCHVILWNGAPISVSPQNFVTLRITETDPGLRGDTSSGGTKPATLETGAVVRVPLFIQTDELLKIDTRTGEYVSRAKS